MIDASDVSYYDTLVGALKSQRTLVHDCDTLLEHKKS